MLKHLTVVTTLALAALAAQEASAATLFYTPAQRAAIRSMPITERPYRPGHFYGNTVRLLNRTLVR